MSTRSVTVSHMVKKKPVTLATRPSLAKRAVSFRLDDATLELLDSYADEHGVDRSTALREAIEALTGHTPAPPAWGWRRGVPNS